MVAHVSLITLGVADVAAATHFYQALGWDRSSASVEGTVSFLRGGAMVLALFGRDDLAADAQVPPDTEGVPAVALAMNLASKAAVDDALDAAARAGGRITRTAHRADWGGYSGYVVDLDGHLWELAHNPGFGLRADGRVVLPDEPPTTGTSPGSMTARASWEAFAADAPRLAAHIRARFEANLHHVIGTVRPNGSPRLSGTEVMFGPDGVGLGMMAGSRKLADVRRDARVEIHSAPLEEDLAAGDAKLAGRLIEVADPEPAHPGAGSFGLLIDRVSLVRVDADELVIASWEPDRGEREHRRR
jgi:uncharacterized protein